MDQTFAVGEAVEAAADESADAPDLASYDHIIVAFSGGKDSLACLLHLLELGAPRAKIELWHHDVDGREGSTLMDWPVTRDYCRKLAASFALPIYFSWKEGGFEREMCRDEAPTAPTWFETPEGLRSTGGKGKAGTRLKFPQVSANLAVRWCSAYLKIDVADAAIRNQDRFRGARTLVVTGERAAESAGRARYRVFEPHRTNGRKRHVDQWRAVHGWSEAQVWDIIRRHRINPHPAYRLGWGRLSCAACIFGSAHQWSALRAANPEQFDAVASYETRFGVTIHRNETVTERADRAMPRPLDESALRAANSASFDEPVLLEDWQLPAGAFGEATGAS